LASILGRAADGTPLANPPLLEALAMDPVLSKTKLIAEAWDAGGLYQVGTFPAYGRWAEWNGKYRDCVRKALKGDAGQIGEFAQRLVGSPDLYPTRGPTASINFVTCHDGFTLADLVSFNVKHNDANGENNSDGSNDNHSWNCGAEGPTADPQVRALRQRQMKNALTILFLSQGVPMLLMGDEVGRSQGGNNNAYCQDGPLNWFDWTQAASHGELHRFCRMLIAFRHQHRVLRRSMHAGWPSESGGGYDVSWHGTQVGRPDWAGYSRTLAVMFRTNDGGAPDAVYAAFNFYWEPLDFELPPPPAGFRWHQFVNTGLAAADEISPPGRELVLEGDGKVTLHGRSIIVLAARARDC
jgi:glycogen operon protein